MKTKLHNPHPGEILLEEFLKPMGISAYRLSQATGIPESGISAMVHGRRSITAETALRFSQFFGTSARFWLGLQSDYDLEEARATLEAELKEIKAFDLDSASGVERDMKAVSKKVAASKKYHRTKHSNVNMVKEPEEATAKKTK